MFGRMQDRIAFVLFASFLSLFSAISPSNLTARASLC